MYNSGGSNYPSQGGNPPQQQYPGGYPQPGYPQSGYPQPGYPQSGYPQQGVAGPPNNPYGFVQAPGYPNQYPQQPQQQYPQQQQYSGHGGFPTPAQGGYYNQPGPPMGNLPQQGAPATGYPVQYGVPSGHMQPPHPVPVQGGYAPQPQQPGGGYAVGYPAQHPGAYQNPPAAHTNMNMGTMKPTPNFNPESDCNILRKAMKGLGTDENAIISILGHRNSHERQKINTLYKTLFGKDLIKELKSEVSGHFKEALEALLLTQDVYDAKCLNEAMKGLGTKESVLTEILCTRTNEQIRYIKDAYKRKYNSDLEKDVTSETSGFFRRVLVSALQANRPELTPQEYHTVMSHGPNAVVDRNLAQREANELFQAGERRFGTDESCFIRILNSRNAYQLRATFEEYQKFAGKDILSSIANEMSGDLADSLTAIALSQINRPSFFARRLHDAMKGLGTKDAALIRIIISRSEIDLGDIKTEFQRSFGKSVEAFVTDETSGDYKTLLLAIVRGN